MDWLVYAIAILTGVSAVTAIFVTYRSLRRSSEEQLWSLRAFYEETESRIRQSIAESLEEPSLPAQRRKRDFQSMELKTFYYLDGGQVDSLLSQIPDMPRPGEIEYTNGMATKKGATITLGPVEPIYQRERSRTIKKTVDTTLSSAEKYNILQNHLIRLGMITFGLELFEYDTSWVDEFKSHCDALVKFGLAIDDSIQDDVISEKEGEFALEDLERISSTKGFIAIQEDFLVTAISEEACTLSFQHPITERLPYTVSLHITFACNAITNLGRSTFRKGTKKTIACIGNVARWDSDRHTLEVNPIAIF